MAKLLSYLYPLTKKVKSEINGTLEITWFNGKKHLNSKNANYSYGSLQRILKFGLEKLNLKNVNSILVLGLGGGSVIQTLRNDFKYKNRITAVEIDPQIITIAKEEFQIESSENLNIICDDALQYVANTSETFDLIIIDLFIDLSVPAPFLEMPFWENILKRKSASGAILFNGSLEKDLSKKLETIISYLKSNIYEVDVYNKVNQTNTVVIGKSI
ncbi:methyltransferase domain-containing protein [Bizionia argentinensis JUB59]|uniref:Methyltransferase domain-containing protein n=1 Tax=Bizionia argentinensis JUB59 TaxID=1046627 RepID=G2EFC9_9FLAO|nr:fused MFS/spermidine synthase [Bizionia argentinensis]EGV42859.1 methyltransferase domain-containing protein [Bizionia argentinensis JUB59]